MSESTLGDCLLHRTHHSMTRDCWHHLLKWTLSAEQHGEPADTHAYKTAYERALLDDHTEATR